MPTIKNSRQLPFKADQCSAHGLQQQAVSRVLGDMPEKTGDSPFGGMLRFGPSNPARKFFDTASPDGSEALLDEFQKRVLPILRACCFGTLDCLASSLRKGTQATCHKPP